MRTLETFHEQRYNVKNVRRTRGGREQDNVLNIQSGLLGRFQDNKISTHDVLDKVVGVDYRILTIYVLNLC